MHDPKLIEVMAWAMEKCPPSENLPPEHPDFKIWGIWKNEAEAALAALCAARPDVAALLSGEAVAVPREALKQLASRAHAMLAASPWAREGQADE